MSRMIDADMAKAMYSGCRGFCEKIDRVPTVPIAQMVRDWAKNLIDDGTREVDVVYASAEICRMIECTETCASPTRNERRRSGMTDEARRIVDALRCCATGPCADCGYNGDDQDCCPRMEQDAADLIERIDVDNERLRYTLQGVMHFVDKWIYGEPYCDIDDPDGKIAVNRAAEAREIALKAIEIVERERDASIEDYEKLRREHDAAVYDLSLNANCTVCNNYAKCADWMATRCAGFIDAGNASPFFEWRGVCAENSGGDADAEN